MYIALKWLVGLALTMWAAMCGVDLYFSRVIEIRGAIIRMSGYSHKNVTVDPITDKLNVFRKIHRAETHGFAGFHCLMFLSGALAVTVLHKKHEIINYTKSKMPIADIAECIDKIRFNIKAKCSKITASDVRVAITTHYQHLWLKIKRGYSGLRQIIVDFAERGKPQPRQRVNLLLLNKLKEIGTERKNLGHLLIAAIHENKNIRLHYQLESMAKHRLIQHMETTQKEIKESRSRFITFQQLYMVTHQENTYLKSCISKLGKDKEEAQQNLMEVINAVYKSKNQELKAYCSRFIVRTKDNLLNSDVSAEIQKFLRKCPSSEAVPSTSKTQFSVYKDNFYDLKIKESGVYPRNEQLLNQEDNLVSLVSDAPKLKGLPGECVWTVRDKHGLINKLYEYDYECDINDGDTIRRIRQYSVYFDKDCLLDYSKSKAVTSQTAFKVSRTRSMFPDMNSNRAEQKFLTGSEAFQKFLQNNNNNMVPAKSPGPPLLCG